MIWLCYPTRDASNFWQTWLDEQKEQKKDRVLARHATVLRFLNLDLSHWRGQFYGNLKGKPYKGLGEIKVHADIQWRILGHLASDRKSFIALEICYHKDGAYTPRSAFKTAARRLKEIRGGLQGIELDVHPS